MTALVLGTLQVLVSPAAGETSVTVAYAADHADAPGRHLTEVGEGGWATPVEAVVGAVDALATRDGGGVVVGSVMVGGPCVSLFGVPWGTTTPEAGASWAPSSAVAPCPRILPLIVAT
ncbi:MAG: hypothetical protein GY698_09255 [Actinomycetia bacterium]|nr:hypothetical protein [Actinomycetes bacterium]